MDTPLIKGGQGRTISNLEKEADLCLFIIKLAIAVLLIVFFLNGCASDMHSGL